MSAIERTPDEIRAIEATYLDRLYHASRERGLQMAGTLPVPEPSEYGLWLIDRFRQTPLGREPNPLGGVAGTDLADLLDSA